MEKKTIAYIVISPPIIGIIYGIISIIIANIYRYSICNDQPRVELYTYLMISGVFGIITSSISIISNLLKLYGGFKVIETDLLMIVFGIFLLSWNIVGAIIIFRDTLDCQDNPMWRMIIAIVVTGWISIIYQLLFYKVYKQLNLL